jgi:hypothetical protein
MNLRTLMLGILLWLPATLWAHTNSLPLRVALVGVADDEAARNVLPMTEALLSREASVVLVERAEIERVLQEQQLSRGALSDSRQAVVLGKLLGAEVFAVFENSPADQGASGLVVFDAGTGIKLSDSEIGGGSAVKQASDFRAAVLAACAKHRRQTSERRTVSVAAVRNADLPRELDGVCNAIARLLQRRLLESADVTLLEREQLEQINRERALPTSGPASELLAALTLLELEFARTSGDFGINVALLLSDARGAALGKTTIAGSRTNIAELVDQLADSVTRILAVASVDHKLDGAREASRFQREAQFLMNHGYIKRGVEAAEAAYALAPDNEFCQQQLASFLVHAAHNLLQPGLGGDLNSYFYPLKVPASELKQSLELAGRALDIDSPEIKNYLRRARLVTYGHDAETRRLLYDLQQRCCNQIMDRARHEFTREPLSLVRCTGWISYRSLLDVDNLAPTARSWSGCTLELISTWLKLAETHPVPWDESLSANHLFMCLGRQLAARSVEDQRKVPGALTAQDFEQWQHLFGMMERHPVPLVQSYGRINRLGLELRISPMPASEALHRSQAIVKRVQAQMPAPRHDGHDVADKSCLLFYRAAIDAIDVLPPDVLRPEARWDCYSSLLDFMLARREIVAMVVSKATKDSVFWQHDYPRHSGGGAAPESLPVRCNPAVLRNIERVLALLNADDGRLLEGDRAALKKELEERRREVARRATTQDLSRSRPWTDARLLFEVGNGLARIEDVVLNGNAACLIALGTKEGRRFIQPLRVNLPGGHITPLDRAAHAWEHLNNPGAVITGVCASDDNIFVGTRQDGIFVFPLNGGAAHHITTNHLPSNWVRSVAWLDGKLYAGLGKDEGFLIAYDLAARVCSTLASSRRKEKRSPLDDAASPFIVRHLRSDRAKRRVIAEIIEPTARGGKQLTGLWEINPQTERLNQILPLHTGAEWLSRVRDGDLLLFQRHPWSLIAFDLRTDTARLLFHEGRFSHLQTVAPGAGTATTAPDSRAAPFLTLADWLWTADPFARVSKDALIVESFPPLLGAVPRHVFDTVAIEVVASGQAVLLARKSQVWLLTLPETQSKDSQP